MRTVLPPPLSQNDTYDTPRDIDISLWTKVLPTTLVYYLKMLPVVFAGSSVAKRGAYDLDAWILSSHRIRDALEAVGCRLSIRGMMNLHAVEGPVVFVGNHMSTAESFLLPSIVNPTKPSIFIVKPSLVTYPVFGSIMRAVNPIVVTRDNPRQDLTIVLEQGVQKLHDGISIILFPQTTRMTKFEPEKFNTLGIKLAQRARVPVIPIALKTDAWGNGNVLKDFGGIDPKKPMHISFGEPLQIEGTGKAEHHKVIQFIEEQLRAWEISDY